MADIELLVPDSEYRPKSPLWNIIFALFIIDFAGIAWLLGNYTFIGLAAAIWAMIIFRQVQRPRMLALKIDTAGISLGTKTWEYKNIKNFSIFESDGRKYLVFTPTGRFQIALKIPVVDPAPISAKLNNYLPQVEYEESLLDVLAKRLGI